MFAVRSDNALDRKGTLQAYITCVRVPQRGSVTSRTFGGRCLKRTTAGNIQLCCVDNIIQIWIYNSYIQCPNHFVTLCYIRRECSTISKMSSFPGPQRLPASASKLRCYEPKRQQHVLYLYSSAACGMCDPPSTQRFTKRNTCSPSAVGRRSRPSPGSWGKSVAARTATSALTSFWALSPRMTCAWRSDPCR